MSDLIESNTNDDGTVEIGNFGSQKRRKFMCHSVSTQYLSGHAAVLAQFVDNLETSRTLRLGRVISSPEKTEKWLLPPAFPAASRSVQNSLHKVPSKRR